MAKFSLIRQHTKKTDKVARDAAKAAAKEHAKIRALWLDNPRINKE